MKKPVAVVATWLLVAGVLAGCGDSSAPSPEVEKPFAAIKQHDTRVLVVCTDGQGHYYLKSLHKSARVTCENLTFRLEDFSRICDDRYVAFPGQEQELEKYLKVAAEEQQ